MNAAKLLSRGMAYRRAGHLAAARECYEKILAARPDHPHASHLLAAVLLETGQPQAALPHARHAVQAMPRRADFLAALAHVHVALAQFGDARVAFERAAALEPDDPALQMGLANCHALLGDHSQAEASLRRLVQRRPAFAEAWLNLANSVRDQNRCPEAAILYRKVLELRPEFVEASHGLAHALFVLDETAEAEHLLRRCIQARPDYLPAYGNLARLLLKERRLDELETVCAQALSINPNQPIVIATLGRALAERGRWSEALRLHRHAASLSPGEPRVWHELGETLRALDKPDEALEAFDTALALDDSVWYIHFSKAATLFSLGAIAEGAECYKARETRQEIREREPATPLVEELPDRLDGKRVLLEGEQGLGDQIFFLRYAACVKDRGARVIFRGDARLASLLGRSPLLDEIVPEDEPVAGVDMMVAVGDLPYVLYRPHRSRLAPDRPASQGHGGAFIRPAALARQLRVFFPELPPPLPLTPRPELVAELRERLADLGPPPYVALSWRAGTPLEEQHELKWNLRKEVPVQQLADALRGLNATLIALQRRPGPGETESFSKLLGAPVHDLTRLNEDLEGMLALLSLLDEYVGVSNTNMHLRAAVGKTARVLVPRPAEWRWMMVGDESPWFPGFRIYRQKPDGGWNAAISALRSDLLTAFGNGE